MSVRARAPGRRWFDPPIETRKDTFYQTLLEWWLATVPQEVRWLMWSSYVKPRPENLPEDWSVLAFEIERARVLNPPPSR
jgi:hypothetical protein